MGRCRQGGTWMRTPAIVWVCSPAPLRIVPKEKLENPRHFWHRHCALRSTIVFWCVAPLLFLSYFPSYVSRAEFMEEWRNMELRDIIVSVKGSNILVARWSPNTHPVECECKRWRYVGVQCRAPPTEEMVITVLAGAGRTHIYPTPATCQ